MHLAHIERVHNLRMYITHFTASPTSPHHLTSSPHLVTSSPHLITLPRHLNLSETLGLQQCEHLLVVAIPQLEQARHCLLDQRTDAIEASLPHKLAQLLLYSQTTGRGSVKQIEVGVLGR